jgi:bifunctional non-homologous end joining protein LigD
VLTAACFYKPSTIELNGDDLRRDPLQVRKATLASILAKARPGIRFNEHMEGDGENVFRHACKLGLEGIVSKRKNSPYRSGHSSDWLKMKNVEWMHRREARSRGGLGKKAGDRT